MGKKRKIFLFDTETQGVDKRYVYDIAFQIVDKNGKVYESATYLVREMVTNPEVMCDAFYHKKVYTDYIPMLDEGAIGLANWLDIVGHLQDAVKTHDADVVSAYNIPFDISAMRQTHKALGYHGPILPYPMKKLCLWLWSCITLCRRPTYHKDALTFGWFSDAGNVRTTAEHVFRYLSKQPDFIEDHTALSDVHIERDILSNLYKLKGPVPYGRANAACWRLAQDCNLTIDMLDPPI